MTLDLDNEPDDERHRTDRQQMNVSSRHTSGFLCPRFTAMTQEEGYDRNPRPGKEPRGRGHRRIAMPSEKEIEREKDRHQNRELTEELSEVMEK